VTNQDQGDNFFRERTGSATMINLDGKGDHNFTDNPAAKNVKLKKKATIDKKNGETK